MSGRLTPFNQYAVPITEERYIEVLQEMKDQIPTRFGGAPMSLWSETLGSWDTTDFSEYNSNDRSCLQAIRLEEKWDDSTIIPSLRCVVNGWKYDPDTLDENQRPVYWIARDISH